MTDPRIEQKAREVAQLVGLSYCKHSNGAYCDVCGPKIIAAALQSAVAEEREECAKICDTWAESVWDSFRDQAMAVKQRADEIRARGQKETA